jgi:F-type H+-transporting ATPase subunit gamma
MAVSTRIIKRRIKSVANTRKITKAMELVAASKMRKAVQLVQSSRAYSQNVRKLVDDIRGVVDQQSHPLLGGKKVPASTLLVIAASDRGLCGGFNSQLLKKTMDFLKGRAEGDIKIVTVGRRAELSVKRAGYPIFASFEAISNSPSFARALPIGHLIFDQFTAGGVDRVFMAYTDFKNAVIQIPNVMQLLPVIPEEELVPPVETDEDDEGAKTSKTTTEDSAILFEPSAKGVLNDLLPRMLETQVYQALLESAASEQSARMVAMRSATDNASDMLEDLTFTFNQARQSNITREISEISAGKAAIE